MVPPLYLGMAGGALSQAVVVPTFLSYTQSFCKHVCCNQGAGPVGGISSAATKVWPWLCSEQRAAGLAEDRHALMEKGVLLPSGSSQCSKSSDALLVLRQKGRGRTKDQSRTDFCLLVLPGALSCL